jgi:hypothetical protein
MADWNGVPLRRRLCVEERFSDSAMDSALPVLKISDSMSIASLVSMTWCDHRFDRVACFACLPLPVLAARLALTWA